MKYEEDGNYKKKQIIIFLHQSLQPGDPRCKHSNSALFSITQFIKTSQVMPIYGLNIFETKIV